MSLGIAFKGAEGIVLAADSRVTLMAHRPDSQLLLPATFDNATKLLRVNGQDFVGVVTYGNGALGQIAPRTAHSYIPEFEQQLQADKSKRLSVQRFASRFSAFFQKQWDESMPNAPRDGSADMVFLIAGYDEGSAYGRLFEVHIPSAPSPREWHSEEGSFGAVWGGQREWVDRILHGLDPRLLPLLQQKFNLDGEAVDAASAEIRERLGVPIPWQFLPLQDCVDMAIFLIRTTIDIQTRCVDVRGVGGPIDVATITRTEGFKPVQFKRITGEVVADGD